MDVRVNLQRAGSDLPEGERKTVTALFADIKDSMELMRDLDPEEARAIVDPALKIMVDAVRRYEGYVVQSTGDGIFALFGAPLAHEDHPQRAPLCGTPDAAGTARIRAASAAQGAHALDARIGINTGEVVVRSVETGGKIEYTPIGHTANLASRLQTRRADRLDRGERTYPHTLIEGYFELRALGPMAVSGISEPINVYEVTGLGPLRTHFQLSARRGLTKFVGRERELEQMKHALELAMSGYGQILAVDGRSRGRQVAAVPRVQGDAAHPHVRCWRPTRCRTARPRPGLPVLELLRDYFGIEEADEPTTRREKVRTALVALDPALQDVLPYLFGLLGIVEDPDPLAQMDPQIKRRRTLDAIKRLILRESLKQPLVVIFEDLHWIDEQTQALLDLLADSSASARVLLLVNYRPEYRHEWGNKSHYSRSGLTRWAGRVPKSC